MVGNVVLEGMAHGVVKFSREGHVAAMDVVVVVGPEGIVLTRCVGAFAHGLIGKVHVEVAETFHPRVYDDGNGGVALHRVGFASVEFPFGQPSVFGVHAEHRVEHVALPFGIDEGEELVDVAIRIPEGEHGVAVAVGREYAVALHSGILPVHILQHVGMDEQMVEPGVEHAALFVRTAFKSDAAEVGVPTLTCFGTEFGKVAPTLLLFEVFARIGYADEAHAHAHFHLLALFGVEGEPGADVVARDFAAITRVDFVFVVVGVPLCLHAFLRSLEFPVTRCGWGTFHTHHEVDGENGLCGFVAERAEEFVSFHFVGSGKAGGGTAFVGESFAKVEEDVRTAFREGEAGHGTARCGGHFGANAVFREAVGVVSGRSRLVSIDGSVAVVVHAEGVGHGGHKEE